MSRIDEIRSELSDHGKAILYQAEDIALLLLELDAAIKVIEAVRAQRKAMNSRGTISLIDAVDDTHAALREYDSRGGSDADR